jgi:hypothetical protein
MPLRQNMFVEGEKTPGAWEGESPHRASVFTDDYGKALDGEILVAFEAVPEEKQKNRRSN